MTWILIAHRCELANPGDYIRVGNYTAYNDDGNVIATDGICPHRGARMLPEYEGNAPLTCPYHGWSYRKGAMRVPDCAKYAAAELEKARLRQYLTCWVGDWLFVSDDSGGYPVLDDRLRELIESIKITRRHSVDRMEIFCDWRIAVENTLEDQHVPTVHRDSLAKLELERKAMARMNEHSIAAYEAKSARAIRMVESLEPHFSQVSAPEYFHLYLHPHTCLSSFGGFTYSLQHYMPLGKQTRFSTRLFVGPEKPGAALEWFYDDARKMNMQVFGEDSYICKRVHSSGHALSADEARIRWFRETERTSV